MIDTITPSAPPPLNAPPPLTGVGSGEATAGTLIAGIVGALTAYLAAKLRVPTEVVTGLFGLVASGAMALWHQLKR